MKEFVTLSATVAHYTGGTLKMTKFADGDAH